MMNRRICLAVLVIFLSRVSAHGATIYVTTLEDKVSSTGGCSLKEAIFSANLHSNRAPEPDSRTLFLPTQCSAGTGDDTIVLPAGAVLLLSKIQDDADNPMGPTATPMITSNITLEANGARLQYVRNFSVSGNFDDVPRPVYFRLFAISSVGSLTLKNAYITGFQTHGGTGGFISVSEGENRGGGGGGMGAGGAIFVRGGGLVVMNSTFDSNGATGGDGANGTGGGGGGGVGGDGGGGGCGGGGGGARGYGASSACPGGGGGTIGGAADRVGGFLCGGVGGSGDHLDGFEPPCDGGGGGSGGIALDSTGLAYNSGNGAKGSYGGGGGSGGDSGGNGGDGGFGGGGGGAGTPSDLTGSRGGTGGFGGGGGIGPNGSITGTGHPGLGGMFGGDANTQNGGGGAALGGAIFNDSGIISVANSTFTNNIVTRGNGGGAGTSGAADNGADAGGAIFSRNGSLTVVDVTVSGNQGTGSGAGVVAVEDGLPTSFSLNDTIFANNGAQECFIRGNVSTTAAGNLIMSNGYPPPITPPLSSACDLSAVTIDPHLGSLFLNAPGITPTMAIGKTSSAWNAGAGTLLLTDQRGMTRPSMGGYDIGAFELCVDKFFIVCILPPSPALTDQLTVAVSPTGAGTTTPTIGKSTEFLGSVALISTKPNTGFSFLDWTGNIADPLSAATTVVMSADQTVTANYIAGTTVLGGNIVSRTGAVYARDWGFNLAVAGVVAAHNAELTGFTLTQAGGPACTPFLLFSLPIQFGDIAINSSVTQNLFFDFSACAANARFTAVATLSANGGGLTGTMTQFNQFQ